MVDIKSKLHEEFLNTKDEAEQYQLFKEIISFIYEMNESYNGILANEQFISSEDLAIRNAKLKSNLNETRDILKSNITFTSATKKIQDYKNVCSERDNLIEKIERAQIIINDSRIDSDKAVKVAISETRKKLQIVRDRLISTALTTNYIGDQIDKPNNQEMMIDTLNNILASISIISVEMDSLGLWPENDIKPNTNPLKPYHSENPIPSERKENKRKNISKEKADICKEKDHAPEHEQIDLEFGDSE